MISDKYKYIFLHTPKCGGSSIEQVLLQIEEALPSEKFSSLHWVDHLECRIKNKFVLGKNLKFISHKGLEKESFSCQHFAMQDYILNFPSQQKDFFKFTFVRNPWDKAVSEWKYFLKVDPDYNFTFQESLHAHYYVWHLYPWEEHNWEQFKYAEGCDFVGRFENLQQDFNTVCDKIGISRQQLPHTNKSQRKHYTEYYDDETREIVAEKFAKDIEHFGYKFGE